MFNKFKENIYNLFFFLLFMVPGIFLFAALSSYDKNDQTIFKFSSITGEINNFMGLFGSYVSGPMIQSLGAVSYLVPVALIIWAFRALFNYRLTWVALTSLPLSIIFLAFFQGQCNLEMKLVYVSNSMYIYVHYYICKGSCNGDRFSIVFFF